MSFTIVFGPRGLAFRLPVEGGFKLFDIPGYGIKTYSDFEVGLDEEDGIVRGDRERPVVVPDLKD